MLSGIDELLSQEIGIPVIAADEPLYCVARGGGRMLENDMKRPQDSSY